MTQKKIKPMLEKEKKIYEKRSMKFEKIQMQIQQKKLFSRNSVSKAGLSERNFYTPLFRSVS